MKKKNFAFLKVPPIHRDCSLGGLRKIPQEEDEKLGSIGGIPLHSTNCRTLTLYIFPIDLQLYFHTGRKGQQKIENKDNQKQIV